MAAWGAPSTVTVACSGIEMPVTMTLVRLTPEPVNEKVKLQPSTVTQALSVIVPAYAVGSEYC